MKCPRCSKALERRSVGGILIHVCPQCSGGLYDPQYLDFDCALEPSRETAAICPACSKHFFWGQLKGTEAQLARCPGCGRVWLDPAQVEVLRKALGRDGFLKDGRASEAPAVAEASIAGKPSPAAPNRYQSFGGWLRYLQISLVLGLILSGTMTLLVLFTPVPAAGKGLLLIFLSVPAWLTIKMLRIIKRASVEIADRLFCLVLLRGAFLVATYLLLALFGARQSVNLVLPLINAAIWCRYFAVSRRVLAYYGANAKFHGAKIRKEFEAFFGTP